MKISAVTKVWVFLKQLSSLQSIRQLIIIIIITSLSPHNAGNVTEYPVTPCGLGYSVPSFRPFKCPALFTESFLTSSSSSSSYDDDDDDDDDDDNDGDKEEKNSEGMGVG